MIRCKTAGSEVGNRTVICSELVHCRWVVEDFAAALAGSGVATGAVRAVTDGAVLNSDAGDPEAAVAGVAAGAAGERKIPEFEVEAGRAGCPGVAECAPALGAPPGIGVGRPAGPGTRVAGPGATGERYVPLADVEGLTGAR